MSSSPSGYQNDVSKQDEIVKNHHNNHVEEELQTILTMIFGLFPVEIELKITRVRNLLKKLGNPEKTLPPTIHIAGTNGKGSTLAMIRSICQTAGLKVHAYTSPHLVSFHERIVLADVAISSPFLLEILQECLRINGNDPITFFELTTCAAFLAFSRIPADILLLETGLGGRLDATNVIENPLMTIITPISLDHTEFLGETLTHIASEKAAIQKLHALSVIAPQPSEAKNVLINYAKKIKSPCYAYPEWSFEKRDKNTFDNTFDLTFNGETYNLPAPALLGNHQITNAATASIAALLLQKTFPITLYDIKKGLTDVKWPSRLQKLEEGPLTFPQVTTYLDGGHNEAGAQALANFFKKHSPDNTLLIIGMLQHKEIDAFLKHIAPYFKKGFSITIPGHHHAISAEDLKEKAQHHHIELSSVGNLKSLYQKTHEHLSQHPHISQILICGSLYLAGEILKDHS